MTFFALALFTTVIACATFVAPATYAQIVPDQKIATRYEVVEGQPHPDFLYPRIDNGEPVSLSEFRGKKVLLVNFASW